MIEQFDVVVIGGGTAGLVTASGCTRLGRKVALIEREALGGDCLWTGCVPTKSLVASAKLAHQIANGEAFGLESAPQKISPRKIMESMREIRRNISRHDAPEKFRKLGIDVIEGDARFISNQQVVVNDRTLQFKDAVIATGSRTSDPGVNGLSEVGFLDHSSFLAQDNFPASLVILGGGYIATEFAQLFRRFGSEVTVIGRGAEIVSREDSEVIVRLREILEGEGVKIRTGWKATSARMSGSQKLVEIESSDGRKDQVVADEIFVATGRRGNIEGLGLEAAGVKTERSWVVVDRYLQTSTPRIWACGDIHGDLLFTHVAAFEAVKLVRNILFPGKSAIDYENVPWALYTDPEVGHIGLTESQAVARFGADNVRTLKVEMADVDRAVVDRTALGFVKFVTDPKGKILGAHAICTAASTVIEEVVLARKKGVKVGELAQLVSPYPSLADAIGKTAALYYQDLATSWIGSAGKKIAKWSQ
ncbi:MAG TPA: FAD-dependent oxidoreductase [Thermoanaerobaculia bacterium]|nr:FAD-dependent oxidoreductase [Thermoanaerobaculia bacterium]